MTRLESGSLGNLAATARVPTFDRAGVRVGIVHFGVGGFSRAHLAAYVDELMSQGDAAQWGICGVGVLPGDRAMRDALQAQDYLYTLVLKHPDGTLEPRIVGSLVDFLLAADDVGAVIDLLAAPATKVVSLTITEGGYNISDATGEFDVRNPAVVRDLEAGSGPGTVFGLVVAALARRRERGLPPFAVMSCDNLPGNGDVARRSFVSFAELVDADLAAWIAAEVPFPNSMVDRITPATTDEDRATVRARFGVDDAWPVVCEPFTQWVLEDRFPQGRPAFERVGVQIVTDVVPYELMKLRLLNASHQALSYFGTLLGYRFVHEAAQDPQLAAFVAAYMEREATPTLPPVPGVDLADYRRTLLDRFANAHVRDTLARTGTDASDRIPKFLLPVVRDQLARGGSVRLSAAIVASWARYAEGVDESDEPIDVVDRLAEQIRAAARRQRTEPFAFLEQRDVFGDLVDRERFASAYTETLRSLHERGARATLHALLEP